MKKNILITWTSRGIWLYLLNNFKNSNNIIWISRTKSNINWFKEINIDLTDFDKYYNIITYFNKNNILLDWIIINAWVWYFWKYQNLNNEKYKEIINLNLLSPIILLKELYPFLRKKAKIIFIWSVAWKKFLKNWSVYQASKFGLRWFAWSLKNELKWYNIHIINPKIVNTTFHDNVDNDIEIDFVKLKNTSLKDISNVIKKIFLWKENRYEIDL